MKRLALIALLPLIAACAPSYTTPSPQYTDQSYAPVVQPVVVQPAVQVIHTGPTFIPIPFGWGSTHHTTVVHHVVSSPPVVQRTVVVNRNPVNTVTKTTVTSTRSFSTPSYTRPTIPTRSFTYSRPVSFTTRSTGSFGGRRR